MIDTPSNPDVISSRTWTAIFISLIALLSHGSYVQAATNRHVRDNVVYGSSDIVTSGTLKDVGKSKETDRVTGHLHSASANDVSVQDNHDDNSPALNSFLENVLKAQNELKWIDQAVRRVDAGEKRFDRFQSRSDRFGRMSDLNSKDIYQTRIRVKRELDQAKGPDASWVPEKKKYENDYRGFPERTYLDDELKFKRDVDPDDFQEDTMSLWASASNENSDSGVGSNKNVDDKNSRDERHLDSKHRNFAGAKNSIASQNPEEPSGIGAKPEEDSPSLESLKKVVLELSKSLAEPDTKTETRKESVGVLKSKNAERHVEEMTGRKEGPSKGEHERDLSSSRMNQDSVKMKENAYEKNDETNLKWWDDPRSAAEIFDFKRRDDDLDDDEEDEEVDGRNSEFDYVMRRVKRDRNDKSDYEENGKGVGVFYRAGFGEYYPNDGQSVSHRFRRDSREDLEDLMGDVDEGVDKGSDNDKIGRAIKVNSEVEKSSDNESKKIEDSKALRSLQDQEKNVQNNKVDFTIEKGEVQNANKGDSVGQEEFSTARNKKEAGSEKESIISKGSENEGSNINSVDPETKNFNKNESLKIVSMEAQLEMHDAGDKKMEEISKLADIAKDFPKEIIEDRSNVKKIEDKNTVNPNKSEKSAHEDKALENLSQDDPQGKKSKDEDTFDVWHVPENGEKVENPLGDDKKNKKRSTVKSLDDSTSKRPQETLARICQVKEELSGNNGMVDNVPGKLITTIFDIKVQKAQLGPDKMTEDSVPKDQSVKEDKMRVGDVFDLYKDKDNLKNTDSKVTQDDIRVQDSADSKNKLQHDELSEDDSKDHVKSEAWYADLKQNQEKKEKKAARYKGTENEEPKEDTKEKRNYPEKNQKGPVVSEKSKYQSKEYDRENTQGLSSKSGELMESSEVIKDTEKDAAKGLTYKDTKRKLLSVTSMLKNLEIRDGRRDWAWDQKESGKHEQGPVNVKGNVNVAISKDAPAESEAGANFKDDLNSRDTNDLASAYTQRKKRKILQEAGNGPEFLKSQQKSEYSKNNSGPQEDSNLKTGVKGPEGSEDDYEGLNEDIENVKQDHDKEKSEVDDQGIDFERKRSLSAYERDPLRDRVNMLIRQRIDTNVQPKDPYIRRRRYPLGTIEYYDYDSDSGEYEKDSPVVEIDQKPEVQQQQQLLNSSANDPAAPCNSASVLTKKDENSEEKEKEDKKLQQLKNKFPKQEFIPDVNLGKAHQKINNATMISGKVPCGPPTTKATLNDEKKMSNDESGKINRSDDNHYRENPEGDSRVQWLGRSAEAGLDPRDRDRIIGPENRRHVILAEPLEYNLNVHGKLEPEAIGAILEGAPVKQRLLDRTSEFQVAHGILSDYEGRRHQDRYHLDEAEEEPTYEELEKINEWKQSEVRPRLRGDQRMFGGPGADAGSRDRADTYSDKAARRNWYSKEPDSASLEHSDVDKSSSHLEQFSEQISKGRRFLKEARDEVPKSDSQDTLKRDSTFGVPDHKKLVEPAADERTYLVISPSQLPGSSNPDPHGTSSSSSSGSNYMALKITDDLFKGGIDQSNPTEEKTPEILGPSRTTTEWKVIKVTDDKDNTLLASPYHMTTEEKHDSIIHTDSGSPYENQRIFKSAVPENNNKIEDRSSVGSKDLMHESFVEPLDLDSEDDVRIRLGRGLMAIDDPELEDLHSFSYPADDLGRTPSRRAVGESEWQEAPVEKYLKKSQNRFSQDGVDPSWTGRASVDREYLKSEKKDQIKRELSIDSNDRSVINFENLKNRIDIPNADQGSKFRTRIGKGLTNVEEWDMNAPILQRHVVFSDSDHGPDAKRIKDSIVSVSINGSNIEKQSSTFEKTGSSRNFASEVNATLLNRDKRNSNYNEAIPRNYIGFGENNYMENENGMNNFLREEGKDKKIRQTRIPGFSAKNDYRIVPGYGKNYDFYGEPKDMRKDQMGLNLKNGFSSNDLAPEFFGRTNIRDYHNAFGPWSGSNRESAWLQDGNNYRKRVRNAKKRSSAKDRRSKYSKKKKSRKFGKRKHHKHRPSSHRKKTSNGFFKNSKNHGTSINFKDSESSLTGNLAAVKDVNTIAKHPLSPECNKILESGMADTEKRVLNENAQDQSTQKPEDDSQKKKFTVLLAPDNMEDESQMDIALHGELAGKIVERIFDQVQGNEALKVALGPGLYRKHKPQEAITSDKIYRQGLDEDEVKHTEAMMRRVMELLGRLILDEVQRKTCASLPPDMRDFLQWMLGVEQEESLSDQSPPLPLVHDQDVPHHLGDKFLFHDPSHQELDADINELYKKVRLLKSLINEYNALTQKEKTKVQSVHDYLVRQLALLVEYIEAKEAEEANGNQILTNGVGTSPQHILQYQSAMPHSNDNDNHTGLIGSIMNAPGVTGLSNVTFRLNDNLLDQRPIFTSHDKRRKARSSERLPRKLLKRKRKRKHKHKHKKHKNSVNQSPEYRKLIRRIALLREKRANSLQQDDWDPFESGYEEPIIYSASGMLRSDSGNRKREVRNREKSAESKERYGQMNLAKDENPHFWTDLAGTYDEDDTGGDPKFEGFGKKLRNKIRRKVNIDKTNKNYQNSYARRSANLNRDAFKENIENNFDNFHASDSRPEYHVRNSEFDDIDYENEISKVAIDSPKSYSKKKREVNNMNPGIDENEENIGKTNTRKRDVLSASVNLQPWLDPKSNDESTSDFLKKFSNLLVHTSNGISRIGETYRDDGEKVDALKVYQEKREPSDPLLSSGGAKNVKRSLTEDEVVLLNKREAWKRENEQQLEEVAFGEDMRSRRSKEEFEKLPELDKRKKESEEAGGRKKRQDEREDESKMAEEHGRDVAVENSSKTRSECHGVGAENNLEMKCKAVDVEKPKEKKSENLMTMEVNIFQVVPANSTRSNQDRHVPEERDQDGVDYLKSIENKINVYSDEDVTEHSKFEKSTGNLEKSQDTFVLGENKSAYENEFNVKDQVIPKDGQKGTAEDDSRKTTLNKETLFQDSDKKVENDVQEVTEKNLDNFSTKNLIKDKRSLDEKQFQDTEQNFHESQNDKIMLRISRTDNKDESANEVPYSSYALSNEGQPYNHPIVKDVALNSNRKDQDFVRNVVKRNGRLASNKNVRSGQVYLKNKRDPAAILPLLEISEQRQMQSQASRAQKDDQRDTADQMLGYENP